MCLHESLNSSPRGITGLCCPPGLYAGRREGKGCAEPPGRAGPLINSHVLQAREWPGNSLLCNVSSAGGVRQTAGHPMQQHGWNRAGAVHCPRVAPSCAAVDKVPCKTSLAATLPGQGCGAQVFPSLWFPPTPQHILWDLEGLQSLRLGCLCSL